MSESAVSVRRSSEPNVDMRGAERASPPTSQAGSSTSDARRSRPTAETPVAAVLGSVGRARLGPESPALRA